MTDVIKPKKKNIRMVRDKGHNSAALVIPQIQDAMDDAVTLMHMELQALKSKLFYNKVPLNREESAKLAQYAKALVTLSREERERDRLSDLSDLSDQQLLELVQNSIEKTKS